MTPFITNSQFLVRYDGRWVGKNVLDDGTAASVASLASPLTPGGMVLEQFIEEASEDVMAAAAVGARYSTSDLVTYGGQLLVRIVSDLTMGKILKRRARALTDEKMLSGPYDEALQYLEQLRRGERIFFAVPDVPEAGLPDTAPMNPMTANNGINPACDWVVGASRYFGSCGCNRGTTWGT